MLTITILNFPPIILKLTVDIFISDKVTSLIIGPIIYANTTVKFVIILSVVIIALLSVMARISRDMDTKLHCWFGNILFVL